MRVWLAALVVACSTPKPTSEQLFPRTSNRVARVPRPTIEVPKLRPQDAELERADLIWPLVRGPSLEPHAALAAIYGADSWRSLCDARRDPRGVDADEAAGYLAAWCGVRRDDLSVLRQQLAVLVSAKSPAIARGARDDLIEVLSFDDLPAKDALPWLRRAANMSGSWELDRLSAAYFAMDREVDAAVVARDYARGAAWVGGLDCRSLLRVRAVLHEPWIRDEIEKRNPADPTCARIAAELDRIDVVRKCPLFGDDPLTTSPCTDTGCRPLDDALSPCGDVAATWDARLAYAYRHWPSLEGNPWVWLQYAKYIGNESPSARTLAGAAVENAALTSDCGEVLPAIRELARTLGDAPGPRYLRELDMQHCVTRYSPTLDQRR